jgi:hypothetical protein
LLGEFRPAKDLCREVPPEVDAAVSKALSSAPADRYSSASQFAEALAAEMPGTPAPAAGPAKRRARRRAAALGSIAIIAIAALSVALLRARAQGRKTLWATQQLAEIERLAESGDYEDAYTLAEEVESIIPDDSMLAALWPRVAYFLSFHSEPTGAHVLRQPYDDPAAEWERLGVTPLDRARFPRAVYRLRLEAEGYREVELLPWALLGAAWRGVPPLDTVRLDTEATLPDGMVRVPGFAIPDPLEEDGDTIVFREYFLGRHEVSNREYRRFVEAGGYRNRDYWNHPFFLDGRELGWEEAMARFKDRTGRPGPSTWEYGTYPDGQEDFPVGGVSWYEAAAYARFAEKELPTDQHWIWALRFYRETSWVLVPGGNLSASGPRPVGDSRAMNTFGIYDLAGNVREWCFNEVEGGRVTRGGAWNDPQFQGGNIIPKPPFDRSAANGVRLATYFDDDSTLAHVRDRVEWNPPRDYSNEVPATQVEYELYRRLYSYDSTPLNAVVEASDTSEYWVRHKVTFDAAYGGERAGVHLYVPRQGTPPFQTVIFWSGSPIMDFTSIDQLSVGSFDYLLRSGRALAVPLLKGTFERDDSTFSITWSRVYDHPESNYFRDISVEWVKDVSRTVDYLETRDDVQSEKLAFYGISWGPQMAPIVLAVEPRIRVASLYVGGLVTWSSFYPLPEVDPFNFLPRVSVPVLMLNGRYDNVFPFETSQKPFFDLLGTPLEHRRHYLSDYAHSVPRDELIRETLAWLDRYLGVPE